MFHFTSIQSLFLSVQLRIFARNLCDFFVLNAAIRLITAGDALARDEEADNQNDTQDSEPASIVRAQHSESRILLIRGQKVVLDADLAELFASRGMTRSAVRKSIDAGRGARFDGPP
jgi:hypothetical protein